MGEGGSNQGAAIAFDTEGNVYTTGHFGGTVDFDPAAGSPAALLTSAGSADIFISKLDADGNHVWVRQIGGPGAEAAASVAVDPEGNVYTLGVFEGTIAFDSGEGVVELTAAGGNEIFISKLSAAGNYLWAGCVGGTADDRPVSIAVDADGNMFITGCFQGTADFDPGAGVAGLISAGDDDIFVSKLNTDGNLLWAKGMGGVGADRSFSIAIDAEGNVYTTGHFFNTADFDPGTEMAPLTAAGNSAPDVFISKLDTNGNYEWAAGFGAPGADNGSSVAVDADMHVYATGTFQGTVDFDPGTEITNLTSGADGANNSSFILKLEPGDELPVTLVSFAAQQDEHTVNLAWKTAAEVDASHFEVERSRDAREWEKIGEVKAHGKSSSLQTYSFTDGHPVPALGYYRLRMVDTDGSYLHSPIESVTLERVLSGVRVYPNPAAGYLTIGTTDPAEIRSVEIYNTLGRKVFSDTRLTEGSIAVGSLPAGAYTILLTDFKGACTTRTVMIRK